jgi:hypothetical protein
MGTALVSARRDVVITARPSCSGRVHGKVEPGWMDDAMRHTVGYAHAVRLLTPGAPSPAAARSPHRAGILRTFARLPMSSPWATVSALAALLAATVGLLGLHVVRGNFYSDDWALAAIYESNGGASHPLDVLHGFLSAAPGRPALGVYLAIVYRAFGTNPHLHLAWTVILTVFVVFGVFAVLRSLSFSIFDSFVVAFLVLVFPFADSTKLWTAAGVIQLAFVFYLFGLVLGLRALRATGRRAWLLHGLSIVLYAGSIMTYESTFALILFSLALYYTKRRDRLTTVVVAVNVVVVAAVLLGVTARTNKSVHGVGSDLHHGRVIFNQSLDLLARVLFPWGPSLGHVVLVLIILGVSSFGLLALRFGSGDVRFRRRLILGLALIGGGVLATAAAYLPYLPADVYYGPYGTEELNRVNAGATIGFAMLVYGLVLTAALIVFRSSPLVVIVSAIAIGIVGSGYIGQFRSDLSLWDRAAADERNVLNVISKAVPQTRSSMIIYLWGSRTTLTSQLPVFSSTWDLPSALRIRTHDYGVVAFPMLTTTGFYCGRTYMYPTNGLYGKPAGTTYKDGVFVDYETAQGTRVTSQRVCRRLVAQFSTPRIVLTSSSDRANPGDTLRVDATLTRGADPLIAAPMNVTFGAGDAVQHCSPTTLPSGVATCFFGVSSSMHGREAVVADFAGNTVLRRARASMFVQVDAAAGG